jgi:hypothetical protein
MEFNTMSDQIKRIQTLLARTDLTTSTRSFAESLQGSCKKWGSLTPKQWAAFQKMEARFSQEVMASQKVWKDAWSEEKARNLKIAAEYYLMNPPYFGDAANSIIKDETYVPSEKLYRKMVENKYVQKVLATRAAAALYPAGSLVKVRKTARSHAYAFRDRIAMVVSTDGPIRSAAKGAKTYTVLPFGESRTIQIQERWLKRHRG